MNAQSPILYGMTSEGGSAGYGTIFKFNPSSNTEKIVWNFGGGPDGAQPQGNMVLNPSNALYYGLTELGGSNHMGAIVCFNPADNSEKVVWSFGNSNDGTFPYGSLIWDTIHSLFYGMTSLGGEYSDVYYPNGKGVLFSFNPSNNSEKVLWNFGNGDDGICPYGSLIWDAKNSLYYGMTFCGGIIYNANYHEGQGTIFSFNPYNDSVKVLWSFGKGNDGYWPYGSLVWDATKSTLYGMNYNGGDNNYTGTIFSFNPSNKVEKVVHSFLSNGYDGTYPHGDLLWDATKSVFYGMTESGGIYGHGTIFSFNPNDDSEHVVYYFVGRGYPQAPYDGYYPLGNLVKNPNNNLLYAITSQGGHMNIIDISYGAIISFNPFDSTEKQVWYFTNSPDGANPYGSMVWDSTNAEFYGMTCRGGANTYGTIFKFNPSNDSEKVVWNLGTSIDGTAPEGDLVWNSVNSVFYGMTYESGIFSENSPVNTGTIFSFNPNFNIETVDYHFNNIIDGTNPLKDLVWDSINSIYYGMAGGGTNGYGTIFSFNPNNNSESLAWNFHGSPDGELPEANLVWCPLTSLFYGMTYVGGKYDSGAIISFNHSINQETVVHNFGGYPDGLYPEGNSLIWDNADSLFYGMTSQGGKYYKKIIDTINRLDTIIDTSYSSWGTIISFNPLNDSEKVLWSFGNSSDGMSPKGNLVWSSSKTILYGMTEGGGQNACGTIFKFNPSNDSEKVIWNFVGHAEPQGDLTWSNSNSLFYGMTWVGGNYNGGVIFSFNPANNTYQVVWNFGNGIDGQLPYGNLTLINEEVTTDNHIAATNNGIVVFPNPNNGVFTLQIDNGQLTIDNDKIEIYNIYGQEIVPILPPPNGGSITSFNSINMSGYPSGIYVYRILSFDNMILGNGKFVIER